MSRAVIDRPAFRLFGRHVGDGADDFALAGQRLRRQLGGTDSDWPQLRQPEVEDLDLAVGTHQTLAGLSRDGRCRVRARRPSRPPSRCRDLQHLVERQPLGGDLLR